MLKLSSKSMIRGRNNICGAGVKFKFESIPGLLSARPPLRRASRRRLGYLLRASVPHWQVTVATGVTPGPEP
jgi:hypothetical protein